MGKKELRSSKKRWKRGFENAVTEAFIPIISEDIRKKIAEGDTFDNEGLSA